MKTIENLLAGTTKKSSRETPTLTARVGLEAAKAFSTAKAQAEITDAVVDSTKEALQSAAREEFFALNHGSETPVSTVAWHIDDRRVTATFSNTYTPQPGALAALAEDAIRTQFELQIDGDLMTPAQAAKFIPELLKLAAEHGVKVTSKVKKLPVLDFGVRRHQLSPADNLRLEKLGLGTRITLKVGAVK